MEQPLLSMFLLLSTWFVFSQLYSEFQLFSQLYSEHDLTGLNLSATCSCEGMCLNWVYRHLSQLSFPEVQTTEPP